MVRAEVRHIVIFLLGHSDREHFDIVGLPNIRLSKLGPTDQSLIIVKESSRVHGNPDHDL